MTQNFLTEAKKRLYLPRLIQDQGGFVCYQCDETLIPDHYCFEHLSNRRNDSRYENVALCCNSCNIKKIDNFDMKLKATDLLKKKEEAGLKYLEDKTAHEQHSSEIQINQALYNFTKQYINEYVQTDGKYSFDDAVAELPFLCQERFGHGSEQTIRKYIKQLTCGVAPLQVIKDESNKKWICKRVMN